VSVTFPAELKQIPHWVVWRLEERKGKPTKVPYRADGNGPAAVDQPESWATARQAYDRAQNNGYSGFGFVVTKDDPYCGIDLDHCRDAQTGVVEPWAQDIVEGFESYTEVTPSGTGLRIWIKGVLPPGGNRKGNIELYDRDRYFTATGKHLAGSPEDVEERQEALEAFHARLFNVPASSAKETNTPPALTTYEIIRRASAAENGPKFDRLMRGDRTGYTSDSEADLALCGILAFWTSDAAQIDQIIRSSGLYRGKWTRTDYAQRTIAKALQETRERWSGGETGGQIKRLTLVPDQTPRPTIEIYSAAELEGAEIPQARAVVPGLIHVGLNMLAGKGKLGKSWIALNLALAVSTGGKALGNLPVQDGDVLYLALEDNKRRMQDRIQMLRDGPFFPRRLHVAHIWPKLDQGGHEAIDDWLEKHPEASLVIVDVWKYIRHKRQRNANLYDEDYEHLVGLKAIAEARQVAMLVVHHTRKMAAEDAFDEISGSGAILAALDTCLILHRPRTEADGELWVTGRDIEEAHLAMRFEGGEWTLLGNASDVAVTKQRQKVTEVMASIGRPVTIREVTEVTGQSYKATKQLMFRMLTAGELHRSNSLYTLAVTSVTSVTPVTSVTSLPSVEEKVTEVTRFATRAPEGCPACGKPAFSWRGNQKRCHACGELYG